MVSIVCSGGYLLPAFAGATLPVADHEEDLAAFLRRLKDMEANGAPAAALVANLLALAREAAV